jgi:hypothetical protein
MRILLLITTLVFPIFLNAQNENLKATQLLLEWTKAVAFIDAYVGLEDDKLFFDEVEACMKGEMKLNEETVLNSIEKHLQHVIVNQEVHEAFEKAGGYNPSNFKFIYLKKRPHKDIRANQFNWITDSELYSNEILAKMLSIIHEIDYEKAKYSRSLKPSQELFYVKDFHKTEERKDIIYFYSFVRFWAIYAFTYPYQKLSEKNPSELFSENIDLVYPSSYDGDMINALNNLNAAIGDNHSQILFKEFKYHIDTSELYIDKDYDYHSNDYGLFEGELLLTEGLIINASIITESGIINLGDTILSINNMDYDSLIDRFGKYTSASTPWALESKLNQLFPYSIYDNSFVLELKRGSQTQRIKLDTLEFYHNAIDFANRKKSYEQEKNDAHFYINPNIHSNAQVKRILRKEYKGEKSIIIDLRDYPSHNDNYKAIVNAFSTIDTAVARAWVRTQWPGVFKLDSNLVYVKNPKGKMLDDVDPKIYFLIDESMQSAAETWAMVYRCHFPNATFVGRTTSGTNGGTPTFELPYGIYFTMCQYGFEWADGTQVQKKGIAPDVSVSKLPLNRRDDIFEKVIEMIYSE